MFFGKTIKQQKLMLYARPASSRSQISLLFVSVKNTNNGMPPLTLVLPSVKVSQLL